MIPYSWYFVISHENLLQKFKYVIYNSAKYVEEKLKFRRPVGFTLSSDENYTFL